MFKSELTDQSAQALESEIDLFIGQYAELRDEPGRQRTV
jgi:hypothetical protein